MRKAKYLKTGKIVNVHNIEYCGEGLNTALIEENGIIKDVSLYDLQLIDKEIDNELISKIDWEQRRFDLVKSAISGLYSKEDEGDIWKMRVSVLRDLLMVADELIKQLKQTNEAK